MRETEPTITVKNWRNMTKTSPLRAGTLYLTLVACLMLTGVVSGGLCTCTSSPHQAHSGPLLHEFTDASGPTIANVRLVVTGPYESPESHPCCSCCAPLPRATLDDASDTSAVQRHWDTNREACAALSSPNALLQGNSTILKFLALHTFQTKSQLRDVSTVVLRI